MTIRLANSLLERASLGKGLLSPLVTDSGTGDWKRVDGAENVKQCIIDLISTLVGERLMNEDMGLERILFESQEAVIDIIPAQIVELISRHEPRVTQVKAFGEPFGHNAVNIPVFWALRSTGFKDSTTYPFYLEGPSGGVSTAL